jgi:hypothetical protein
MNRDRYNTGGELETLDLSDLIVQWKIMRGLGYKSLFDPEFRREIKNPIRRAIYYRIVLEEEYENRKFITNLLDSVSDKLGYFSDPELYKQYQGTKKRKENKKTQDEFEKQQRLHDFSGRAEELSQIKEILK